MLYLGLLFLAVCIVILAGALLNRINLLARDWFIFAMIAISGLMFVAFSVVPPESWDLTRHYELIEEMKAGGLGYVFNESIYTHLPIVNILYGLIAFTGVTNLLPAVVVFICYGLFTYMIFNVSKSQKTDSRIIACIIIFNLALCPYLHMVSGIRNILAFAVCAFAFYSELMNNRIVCGWALYISAIFIHPAAILILIIRILYTVYKKVPVIGFFVLAWSLLAGLIVKLLLNMPIAFLESIGWKLNDYLGNREFSGYKILLVKLVLLLSVFVVIKILQQKEKFILPEKMKNYMAALEITILVAVGSFKVVFIADRLCYFIAFFSIPALIYIYNNCKGRLRYLFAAETAAVSVLLFLHQIVYFSKS